MTRPRSRPLALSVASLALCLVVAAAAPGQSGGDLKSYKMTAKDNAGKAIESVTGDMIVRMGDLKSGKLRTKGPDEKANKDLFRQVAQLYVYKVTEDKYYVGGDTGELKPRTTDQTIDGVLDELASRYVLVQPADARVTGDQADYVRDFGAALDEAIVAVLSNKMPPTIIRINAARALAVAARSGAPAHAKTITALLTNQFFKVNGKPVETPPEVLFHALRAAEALLGSPDAIAFNTPVAGRHTVPDADLIPLVQVIEKMVLNGPPVADKAVPLAPTPPTRPTVPDPTAPPAPTPPPAAKSGPTAEQVAVVRYFRRQAVRALARVRHDVLPSAAKPEDIVARPAYTLAKVAVADRSITPTVTAAEAVEAAIGLCGVIPGANVDVDVLIEAVGRGLKRAYGEAGDAPKVITWKLYAARTRIALDAWRAAAPRNVRLQPHASKIVALADIVKADVLDALDKPDKPDKPNLARLDQWESTLPPDARSLFKDSPQYKLEPGAAVPR